jgi:hypothetical protein
MLFQLQKLHVVYKYMNAEQERLCLTVTAPSHLRRLFNVDYEDSSKNEFGGTGSDLF